MYIYHKKTSAVANPADTTLVGGGDWNDGHNVYGPNPVAAGFFHPQNLVASDTAITGCTLSAYSSSNTSAIILDGAVLGYSIGRLVCSVHAWSATEFYDVRAAFNYPGTTYDNQSGYELRLSYFTRAGVAATPTSVHFVVFKV